MTATMASTPEFRAGWKSAEVALRGLEKDLKDVEPAKRTEVLLDAFAELDPEEWRRLG